MSGPSPVGPPHVGPSPVAPPAVGKSAHPRFDPRYGEAVDVAPGVQRITCENPSPFTLTGTNSYLIDGAENQVLLIDPGPDIESHREALHQAIGKRQLVAVLVTHSHRDHTTGIAAFQASLPARIPVHAFGPHRLARSLKTGEPNRLAKAGDWDFNPDILLADRDEIVIAGLTLKAIYTPGHCANHMSFAFPSLDVVFSGDNMFKDASTLVAPPEGGLSDYLKSLKILKTRPERLFLPGHGEVLSAPQQRLDEIIAHRENRLGKLMQALKEHSTPTSIETLTAPLYRDISPDLMTGAQLSVQAQLEYLLDQGRLAATGAYPAAALYRLADGAQGGQENGA